MEEIRSNTAKRNNSRRRKSIFNEDLSIQGEKDLYPPGYTDLISFEIKGWTSIAVELSRKEKAVLEELERNTTINAKISLLPSSKQTFLKKKVDITHFINIVTDQLNNLELVEHEYEMLGVTLYNIEKYKCKKTSDIIQEINSLYTELLT